MFDQLTLHDEAFKGNLKAVKHFIEKMRINVNKKESGTGEIALHRAAKSGQVEVVDYLLRMGADIYAQSKGGSTSFIRVVIAFECCDEKEIKKAERCYQVMELLLQYENELRQKNPEDYQNKPWLIDFGIRGNYIGSPRSSLKIFAGKNFLTPFQQQQIRRLTKLFADWDRVHNNIPGLIAIEDKEVIDDRQHSPHGNESRTDSDVEHDTLFSMGSPSFFHYLIYSVTVPALLDLHHLPSLKKAYRKALVRLISARRNQILLLKRRVNP